ncbi:MAG: phosphomannomutase/phosphoglucomutase [Gammaproteobacteria bacterium]|nr:phosphomannomutase/phosphoglucomutase [Gammaproteobacteria bacterium]
MKTRSEIFKAYDIRGIVDDSLTEQSVTAIGQAIGSEAVRREQDTIVVGRDGRLSGPALSAALSDGIRSAGCDVVDIGCVPTPVVYFATHHLGTGSGCAVTGSHNPPQYNGIKMMVAGETLSGDAIQSLRQRIEDNNFSDGNGEFKTEDVVDAYVQRITSDVKLEKPLRIVIDCGNGVAGGIAPRLFNEIGCEVHELFCEVDGNFPNHHPDPSQPENLQDVIAKVKKVGADVGLAFDGDGDRCGVVTPDGDIVWSDRVMSLFTQSILKQRPGAEFIYDVKCSQILPTTIRDAGGQATMWKTGHSLIKAKLKETGAAMAGEMSGHFFFNERWYGFDDGLYAGARLCELIAADSRSSREIFADIPNTVNTPELRLEMKEGEHHALIEKLVATASFPDGELSTIDGVRVDFDNGFGLARASNTTPTIILRFEADNQENLAKIQDRFRDLFEQTQPGLELPF